MSFLNGAFIWTPNTPGAPDLPRIGQMLVYFAKMGPAGNTLLSEKPADLYQIFGRSQPIGEQAA